MVEIIETRIRGRGRPQTRCDEDTRELIIEAANQHFCEFGFAASNINLIAKTAGISVKTLYRLYPAKSDVFESVVKERMDRYVLTFDESEIREMDVRTGLVELLTSYGALTLSDYVISVSQLVIAEAERFPEIAQTFYDKAIMETNRVFLRWLAFHTNNRRIEVGDAEQAAGMLRGMMIMEPQRAVFLRQLQAPTQAEIRARAERCADLFLHGCLTP